MSTFRQQKNFFHRYGHLIGHPSPDMLHWYFSNQKEPTADQVRAESLRQLALYSDAANIKRSTRKNRYRRREKTLRSQVASIAARCDICLDDKDIGIPAEESLACAPLPLFKIRELRRNHPATPLSKMWIQLSELCPC